MPGPGRLAERRRLFQNFVDTVHACALCPGVVGPPVCGAVFKAKILSLGQAPGPHEARFGRPFAYTAGRTLFKWFASVGIAEDVYRANVNMSAVLRCFPGKPRGKAASGDRIPSPEEIENCSRHLKFEFEFHRPRLVIPIGKLAIASVLPDFKKTGLAEIIGRQFESERFGVKFDCIPLPHPSGLNAWNNMEPGKTLIRRALSLIAAHEDTQSLLKKSSARS